MNTECQTCHKKTVEKLIQKHQPQQKAANLFRSEVNNLFEKEYGNPVLATRIHRSARNILNQNSLYEEEKKVANAILLDSYKHWQNKVNADSNPFYTAAKLAVSGNIIDYGAHSVPENIEEHVETLLNQALAIDHSWQLLLEINKANSILYLGDNAGEIVFDKLFIETTKHPNVTYVVRGKPVINDVTFTDAEQVGINKLCKVISNGYDAPSTILNDCSNEFIEAYHSADLIISKGMGNFEGLMHEENSKIFFMLMAKCNPIAELLGVKKGDMLIKRNNAN